MDDLDYKAAPGYPLFHQAPVYLHDLQDLVSPTMATPTKSTFKGEYYERPSGPLYIAAFRIAFIRENFNDASTGWLNVWHELDAQV